MVGIVAFLLDTRGVRGIEGTLKILIKCAGVILMVPVG